LIKGKTTSRIEEISDMKKEEFLSVMISFKKKTARLVRLVRGGFIKLFFRESGERVFIGKRTTLRYGAHISIGNNVTINDYVELIAESKSGVIMGNNINIGKFSIIKSDFNGPKTGMTIGDNFGCGDNCYFGCAGGIKIGNDVIMGQNVRFHAQNHNFDRVDIPIREQGTNQLGIIIEDDCWIGAGTVVLDGVTIGKGSVIGANSLVNKDVASYSVAVGNPVKVVRSRI
jgi:acetyltransferase-like isoleucine patch superfamily enzyme